MNQKSYLDDLEAAVELSACTQPNPAPLARSIRADVEKVYLLVSKNELPVVRVTDDKEFFRVGQVMAATVGKTPEEMETRALEFLAAAEAIRTRGAEIKAARERQRVKRRDLWIKLNPDVTFSESRFQDGKTALAKAIDEIIALEEKLADNPAS